MNNIIEINNQKYEIITNYRDAIDSDEISIKLTDYFANYDYIVGDWAYNKLRLKGFCDNSNSLFKENNDVKIINKYIKENCAFGCKWFNLRKIK